MLVSDEAEVMFMPTYRLERHTPGYKYDWRKVKKTGVIFVCPIFFA
jgi:hypothetical protein